VLSEFVEDLRKLAVSPKKHMIENLLVPGTHLQLGEPVQL
jgi:hypothetical protein